MNEKDRENLTPNGADAEAPENTERGGQDPAILEESAESTETPAESTETPAESTETPAESTETPAESAETSDENAETSDENTETPAENTETSDENTETSDENTADGAGNARNRTVLPFDFGGISKEKEKKGSIRTFFLLFAGLTGACLLLLFFTLWLGNSDLKITREVQTERIVYVREYDSASGLLTPNEVAELGRKSTVTISITTALGGGVGSGFVYTDKGYIVTNYHVIEDCIGGKDVVLQVVFPDGGAVDAEIVGYDETSDLAVLQVHVAAERLVPVAVGSSDLLLSGDGVVAIGTPAKLEYAGTATFGYVSNPKRLLPMTDEEGNIVKKMTVIQTDASVNPGNSGGPLFDMYGKVVGIVAMKVTQYGGTVFDGLGFAIPIDGAMTVINGIIEKGEFHGENPLVEGRSLLGITGHGGNGGYWYSTDADGNVVSSEVEQPGYYYMPVSGIYVMEVTGASVRTQVRVGDIILRVNGLVVTNTTALIDAVNRCRVGETVTLTLYRDGREITVRVALGEG